MPSEVEPAPVAHVGQEAEGEALEEGHVLLAEDDRAPGNGLGGKGEEAGTQDASPEGLERGDRPSWKLLGSEVRVLPRAARVARVVVVVEVRSDHDSIHATQVAAVLQNRGQLADGVLGLLAGHAVLVIHRDGDQLEHEHHERTCVCMRFCLIYIFFLVWSVTREGTVCGGGGWHKG